MPYLTAAVVLVGVVAIVALLLVIALARRIRELGASAGGLQPGQTAMASDMPVGSRPPDFRVVTLSGGTVSLDGLSGDRALVGFFLAGCTPCNRQLPAFVELAKTILGGPSQVIAVLSGMPDKTAEYAARLAGAASVVLESPRAGLEPSFELQRMHQRILAGELPGSLNCVRAHANETRRGTVRR